MPIRIRQGGRYVSALVYKRGIIAKRRRAAKASNRYAGKRTKLYRMIQSMMNRNVETKYVANNYNSQSVDLGPLWFASPNIVNVGSFNPAIPQMTQGVGDFQRVGNKVAPKTISVTLKVGFNALDLSANSLIGVIYYGTDRVSKTWQNNNPVTSASILDNGDGTDVTWAGLRNQLNLPIDNKLYNMKKITFRLSKSGGIQNNDIGGVATQPGNFSTSNGLSEKSFLLKFKAPKVLTYNLQGDVYPVNFAPFYYIGFCHADGSALTAADRELVNVSSKAHMWYKDA